MFKPVPMSTPSWHGVEKRPPPLISLFFSEIFSPSHIKLTNHKPNEDFKSVKRR